MAVLEGLMPREVFSHFEQICSIPHGSGHTRALSDACLALARPVCCRVRQDDMGNLILWQDASPDREGRPPVILQAHLDMVLEQEADCSLDLLRDGLRLEVEGDWVRARGTTLGGDDGIGVALCLAALTTPGLCHPPLEVVLTVDEEVGMLGAAGLDMSELTARRMINLDAEEEGLLLAGCAGGVTVSATLPLQRSSQPGRAWRLSICGLAGGHSGTEIHRCRSNACLLLGQALERLERQLPIALCGVNGGAKDNAIPRTASADFCLAPELDDALADAVRTLEQDMGQQCRDAEPGFCLSLQPLDSTAFSTLTAGSQRAVVFALLQSPNGVIRMNPHLPEQVETSLNLGVLETRNDQMCARYCVRSSSTPAQQALLHRLTQFYRFLGGTCRHSGAYPPWTYRPDSPLRRLMAETYTQQTGRPMRVETLHAGLECGLFDQALPGLDCVSCGPDILDIHTPQEKMSNASVQRVWRWLTAVLKQL